MHKETLDCKESSLLAGGMMEPYPAPATTVQQSLHDHTGEAEQMHTTDACHAGSESMFKQDAPFEVPGDASRLEPSLEPSVGHMDGVLAPRPIPRGPVNEPLQLLLQQGELQEQVIRVADAGRVPANLKGAAIRVQHKERNEPKVGSS